jgi:hypothetical protein
MLLKLRSGARSAEIKGAYSNIFSSEIEPASFSKAFEKRLNLPSGITKRNGRGV